jgi:type II secretory pathway component PulF
MNKFLLWFAKLSFAGTRIDFYEDLAEALNDRASLSAEIDKLALRAAQQRDASAPLLRLWSRRMEDRSFALSLVGTVPDGDVMVLEGAEESGRLADGLQFLSRMLKSINAMKSALKGAVIGFVGLSAYLLTLLCLFSFYGIGIIEQVVPPNAWPWIGQVLRDVAHFVTDYGIWVMTLMIFLSCAFIWSLPNWRGKIRVQFDRYVPMYTIYRNFQGAIFLISLAALTRENADENGVVNGKSISLNSALEKLRTRANPWLRWHISRILMNLDDQSANAGLAFNTGLFDQRLTWRIADFGARNHFAVALEKVGLKLMDTVTDFVLSSAKKINTLLLCLTGAMMAFMIVGILLTMFEAQEVIQKQANVKTSFIVSKP